MPEADENTPEKRFGSEITGEKLLGTLNDSQPSYFRTVLRERVDSWINSGKIEGDKDEAEDFRKRGYPTTQAGQGETPQEKSERISNAFSKVDTILRALPLMFRRVQTIEYTPDGNFEIQFPGGLQLPEGSALSTDERDAEQLFCWLLLSKSRYTIAKCRRCNSYLIKQRMPRKGYARRFLCRPCRSAESAARRVANQRADLTKKRLAHLRAALTNWPVPFDPLDLEMRKRLAREVNRGLKHSERITSKWFTTERLKEAT